MAALQNTSGNASLLKKILKKIFPSRSTRKSWREIGKALSITVFIIGSIALLENEQKKNKLQITSQLPSQTKTDKLTPNDYPNNTSTQIANPEVEESKDKKCEYKLNFSTLICLTSDLKLLAQAQNIAVISAAILFFLDTFDRKKQLERQAWQLIDGAQGAETSGARRQAIEELFEEGSDITGLDADGADLRGINLSGANLERASFQNAILEGANFEGADLTQANFTGSNLRGANFKKATLLGTIFTKSDLRFFKPKEKNGNGERPSVKTDFRDADLRCAIFHHSKLAEAIFGTDESETSNKSLTLINNYKLNNQSQQHLGRKTDLRKAIFWNANLNNTNLINVDISGARFGGADVHINTIKDAYKYQEAFYGKDFCEKNNLSKPDEDYDKNKQLQYSNIQKMLEIAQYVTNNKSVSALDEDGVCDILEYLELLKNFIKGSKNPCFLNNDLFDQVLKVEDAGKQYEKSVQDLSAKIKSSQELRKDQEDRYDGSQRLLEELKDED